MSTNIYDLPTNPAAGNGNMKINTSEAPTNESQVTLDQNTINQIVSGLQQASATGSTQLQSRDISQNTEGLTNDAQIQPNYIPPTSQHQQDYIQESYAQQNQYQHQPQSDKLDDLYNEIQTPLFLSILYFLFQLPVVKKQLFTYMPILFSKDGNMNIHGFIATSILFGFSFYSVNKSIKAINRF
jgi:hypothetical protein